MSYTIEQIAQVEEYAGYLMPISDIAYLINVDPAQLRLELKGKSEIAQAYRKGKALTTLALHKQEVELAKVGSPLAVQLTAGYLLNMSDDEENL